jgi:hypothetical protein
MTGRQKIDAALSPRGTGSIPAIIPYESVMIRDRWEELLSDPWWHLYSPELEVQLRWRRAVHRRIENDLLELPQFHARREREFLSIERRRDGMVLLDRRSGRATQLEREPIGGVPIESLQQTTGTEAKSPRDIDRLVPPPAGENPEAFLRSGKAELAQELLREFGRERYPIVSVRSPLWACHHLWSFDTLMVNLAGAPDLVRYACVRYLDRARQETARAAAVGAAGVWIEECLTDLVSPETYASISLPYLQNLVEWVHAAGMCCMLYYCGEPAGKMDLILSAGCDAVGFEESKKGFRIDIERLPDQVAGRCALLGNVDAVEVIEKGNEEALRAELRRQIRAGRRNRGRFIMSSGSPITPATPIERIRTYLELARELGQSSQ